MLIQILTHTPIHVWALLVFLIHRGIVAMHDREVSLRALCIIPLVMLGLSLQDIAAKFGLGGLALAAWAGAAALALMVSMARGNRAVAASTPGTLHVRGSWVPLALMMAVFFTKYTVSVVLAIAPQLREDGPFVAIVCALFGVFNGCFLGRLALNLRSAGRQELYQ
jgi:hypothetical protein